jgi:NitT/TauT family transport system substrate-binding protein
MIPDRRACLRQMLALSSLLLLGGCASREKLRIAAHPWPGYAFMFLARDNGWFSADHIELVATKTASDNMQAVIDGRVNAAALTLDEVLRVRAAGVPLSIVLVFDISAGADVVLARPDIRTLDQVAGRRVGVEVSALGALMFRKMLEAGGLSASDVTMVPMSGAHREPWDSGAVDVLITYEPTGSELQREGASLLFDSRQVPDTIYDTLAVRSDMLDQLRRPLRELIDAHLRGVEALRLHPQDTAYRLAPHLGFADGEFVEQSLRGLRLLSAAANHYYLRPPSTHLLHAAELLSRLMMEQGLLERVDDAHRLAVPDYLPLPAGQG